MNRFQLVFRRPGEPDRREHHISSEGQPTIGGRPLLDAETYEIGGEEWIVRREEAGKWERFVCTPVVRVNA